MRVQGIKEEIQGILFDMDGLLVNSEDLYWQANMQAAQEAGLRMPTDSYLKLVGASPAQMAEFYRRYFASSEQRDRFIKRTDELVWQWTDEGRLQLRPGVQEALDVFYKKQLSLAIVTSNTEEVVEHNLWVTGVRNYFRFHLNLADVKENHVHPKPAPDIYLLAAQRLGLPKERVLVFEDSAPGLAAAVNAGLKCVLIPDLLPPTVQDRKIATMICSDFTAFLRCI